MKKTTLLILMAIFALGALTAQDLKTVFLDTTRLMEECEDGKAAQLEFGKEEAKWKASIDEIDARIEVLKEEYDKKKMMLAEKQKQEKELEIATLQKQRQNTIKEIFGEEGSAAKKNAELMKPILKKLRRVLDRVAQENKFGIVLDSTSGTMLYGNKTMDITDLMITEMNKPEPPEKP